MRQNNRSNRPGDGTENGPPGFHCGMRQPVVGGRSGRCARPVRPVDQDRLSLRGRRQRRHAVPPAGAISSRAPRPQFHRGEPHRRRRADRHQGGEGRQPGRHHHPGDDRPDHVPAADGGERAELRSAKGFRSGVPARPLRVRRCREPIDRREGFAQLVAWIKANPAKATYGVPSSGTIPHFTGWQLEQVLGLSMTRVPYRGSAPIINELVGGHLPLAVTTLSDTITQHRAGAIRIVAVSGPTRSPFLPDAPTLKEAGVDIVADGWYGMWLPAGSSPEFAKKPSAAAAEVLAKPDVKEKLNAVTLIPVASTPEDLTKALAADTAFWQPIVKATGYKITN